jgi:heptosyltransferase-1
MPNAQRLIGRAGEDARPPNAQRSTLNAQPRVLVIRTSAIGDVIIGTPVTRAVREALPDAHLAWVVEPRAADVLRGNPYLDEVILWDRPKGSLPLGSVVGMATELRRRRFDCVIDLQGLMRTALLGRLSGARRLVGNAGAKEWAGMLYDVRVPKRTDDLSSRQRCLDLLEPLGIRSTDRRMVFPLSADDRSSAASLLDSQGIAPGEAYACLVPATTWAQKHWVEPGWSELAGRLAKHLGVKPVILGGKTDLPLANRIAEAAAVRCANLAGRTSLKTAGAVLEGARLTVAVDTALMHASVALGTPTVALCGASGWYGFADYERFTLLREPLPCSPCLHHPTCGGRFDCMRALTPDRVLEAAEALLGRRLAVVP